MRPLVFLLVLAGCGPTVEQLLQQNAAATDGLKNKVAAAAAAVKQAPPPAAGASCRPPAPLHFAPKGEGHDTDLLMLDEALAGGKGKALMDDKSRFDLFVSAPLGNFLAWNSGILAPTTLR